MMMPSIAKPPTSPPAMAPAFVPLRTTGVGVTKVVVATMAEVGVGDGDDVGDGATDPGGADGELVAIAPIPLRTTEGLGYSNELANYR